MQKSHFVLRSLSTFIATFLLAFPLLQAETHETTTSKKYSYFGKLIVPRPNTVYSDSSEVMREGKTLSAHLAVGLLAYQAGISLFINPVFLVEADYTKQKDYFSGMMNLATLSLLYFFENSTYGRLGWTWRKGSPAELNSIVDEVQQAGVNDNGIDVGFGNRWQWENVSVGVEWLGAYSPLIHKEQDGKLTVQLRLAMLQFGLST